MDIATFALAGSVVFGVLGWLLRRVVSQNDVAIAELRENVTNLKDRIDAHEAAHMVSGHRLDRSRKND